MDSFDQDDHRPSLFVGQGEMEDDDYEPMFVDPESILRRATDSDGRPFPTTCFKRPHLEHPHHHRLFCGHDIVTPKIEACGATCEASKDKKAGGQGFACPHPECMKLARLFIQKRGVKEPRVCTLSHVYGLDPKADEARKEEKRILAQAQTENMATRSGSVLLPRTMARNVKRSESPEGRPIKQLRRSKRITTNVDTGDQLNRELGAQPGFGDLMQLTRGRPRNSKFKTDREIAEEVEMAIMNRDFNKSKVANKEEQLLRSTKLAQVEAEDNRMSSVELEAFNSADNELPLSFDSLCAYCTSPIKGMRYHCFDCEDYDLCQSCFDVKDLFPRHATHSSLHRFKGLDSSHDGLVNNVTDVQAVFCVCQTTSTSFLVLCDNCETPFHPGCIGIGAYEQAEYDPQHFSRGSCMKSDYLNWKGGKAFRCKSCQDAKDGEQTNAADPRELRIIERAKKREANMAIGIQSPQIAGQAKKRGAEEMAGPSGTDEIEEDIPSPFAKRAKSSATTQTDPGAAELFGEEDHEDGDSLFGQPVPTPSMGGFEFNLPMRFK